MLPNPSPHCSYFQFLFFLHSFLPLLVFSQSLTSFYIPFSTFLFLSLLQTPLSFCPWFYPRFYSSLSSASPSVLPLLHPGSPHHISCHGIFVQLTVGDDWLPGKTASLGYRCSVQNVDVKHYLLNAFNLRFVDQLNLGSFSTKYTSFTPGLIHDKFQLPDPR